jgi:Transposase DDE domain group 1
MPRRMSVWPVAIHTRTPEGMGIIAAASLLSRPLSEPLGLAKNNLHAASACDQSNGPVARLGATPILTQKPPHARRPSAPVNYPQVYPDVYEFLEAERIKYAIRLPANRILQERIGHLLTRPIGRPPNEVQRSYANFTYQAGSWTKPRRIVAMAEVAIPRNLFADILRLIAELRPPPVASTA